MENINLHNFSVFNCILLFPTLPTLWDIKINRFLNCISIYSVYSINLKIHLKKNIYCISFENIRFLRFILNLCKNNTSHPLHFLYNEIKISGCGKNYVSTLKFNFAQHESTLSGREVTKQLRWWVLRVLGHFFHPTAWRCSPRAMHGSLSATVVEPPWNTVIFPTHIFAKLGKNFYSQMHKPCPGFQAHIQLWTLTSSLVQWP